MSDVLAMAGVGVVRGDTVILDDVSWEVEEGQRWVVLGPNGAGKTTLLQLAAGPHPPDHRCRRHPRRGARHRRRLRAAPAHRPRLGRPRRAHPRPRSGCATSSSRRRTGSSAGGARRYDRLDEGRADELLEALGADHLADRRFGTLSEGERKRVQIARALMTDPELMLLDEPAAGLDLGGREDLVRRLGELAADLAAPALVLVTHHVEEVPPHFTDVLLVRDGRVVAQGPIEITLTADNLEATFGLPLELEVRGDRYAARAR